MIDYFLEIGSMKEDILQVFILLYIGKFFEILFDIFQIFLCLILELDKSFHAQIECLH